MNDKSYSATLIMDRLNPFYIKLTKRLQQLTCSCPPGFSMMTVTILMIDGEPIIWTKPEINTLTTVEPNRNTDIFYEKLKNLHK